MQNAKKKSPSKPHSMKKNVGAITSADAQAGPKKKSVSATELNSMTNPAHQSHKVSGVYHYTTVSVLQDLHLLAALCKPVYLHREV